MTAVPAEGTATTSCPRGGAPTPAALVNSWSLQSTWGGPGPSLLPGSIAVCAPGAQEVQNGSGGVVCQPQHTQPHHASPEMAGTKE